MSKTKRDSKLIDQRQQEQKKQIVDQLRKIPIIQVACEKNGVARATYYRWVAEDAPFASETEEAIREGTAFINDMAETQLITLIKDQNYPAIAFWLRNRHRAYADKLRIDAAVTVKPRELTPEESALMAEGIRHIIERRNSITNQPQTYATPTIKPGVVGRDDQPDANEPAGADAGGEDKP